jgi:hypothetical protein
MRPHAEPGKRMTHPSDDRRPFPILNSQFSILHARSACGLARIAALILVSALAAACTGCLGVNWELSQQAGLRKAAQNNQRAMIEFVSTFDSATSRMHDEVFSDPDVLRLMQRYVAIRLDAGLNKQFAEQLGVTQTPAFFVVRPDMTVSGSYQGVMKKDQFRLFLIRNSLN